MGDDSAKRPARAVSSAFARKLAWTLGLTSVFGPFAIDMYLPAFPKIAEELSATPGQVQWTLAAFLLGLAIGQVFWGTLSDQVGRRRPLLAGCAFFIAAAVVCAWTRSIAALIVVRFVMGLGGSAGVVVSRAIVRDLFEEREAAKFFSMMMIIGGIGPIVSPFLGSMLLIHFGWRTIFWTIAGFGVICMAAVAWAVPETLAPKNRTRGHVAEVIWGYGRILANRRFLTTAFAISCTSGILFTYIANASFIFIQLFGVPVAYFGFLFATNSIGLYIGGQSNCWLLRRFSPEKILFAGMSVNVAAAALLVGCAWTGVGGFPVLYGVLFLCLATLGIVFPNATAIAMSPFATEAGGASALLGVFQYILGAAGGAMAGLFHNGTALPMSLQIALYGAAALSMLFFMPIKTAEQ